MNDYGSVKREAPDDYDSYEGPTKRQRSGGHADDVRFLVKSKNAGAIIGKGGSNIKRLRTDFKASVTVPDCSGPERILSIGADTDTLGDILLDVLPKLDDYSHHNNMEFDCELRMLVHQSHAGCLIGKGGSRIKEVREKTGAQIKIYSTCCPNSTERIVLITGVPKIVVNCVKEVCDIVSQSPVKGPNKPYDPHNFDPMYANEYGGYEDTLQRGKGRGSFRGRQPPPAWRDDMVDNFSFGGHDVPASRGSGFSSFEGRGHAGLMGPSPSNGRWGQAGGGPGGNSSLLDRPGWGGEVDNGFGASPINRNRMLGSLNGGSGLMGQGMGDKMMGGPRTSMLGNSGMGGYQGSGSPGLNGPSSRYMGPRQGYATPVPGTEELFSAKPMSNAAGTASVRMEVPNDVAGAIIGKGGQRIRKIRRDSAATINIEESSSRNDRIITIIGTLGQVNSAQFLMQQSVHENPPNRGRF